MLIIIYWSRFARNKFPIAYNVAIVGFPQSGKTTLITYLFKEIFEQNIANVNVKLSSESTINRLNENLKILQQGFSLPPTKDSDVFAYRADLTKKSFLSSTKYQIQVGDFPGENSNAYIQEYGEWLHSTPFFKWASAADAVVFIIDISCMFGTTEEVNQYVATISSAIRAAWQHMLTDNTNETRKPDEKPVVVAFTKTDVCLSELFRTFATEKHEKRLPKIITPSTIEIIQSEEIILSRFDGLFKYLASSTKRFDVVFTSGFVMVKGKRMGLEKLLKSILP